MIEGIAEEKLLGMDSDALQAYLDDLFLTGQRLVNASKEWPLKKTSGQVTIRVQGSSLVDNAALAKSGHKIIQRSSEHSDVTYDDFRAVLLVDHTKNEPKYIAMLEEAQLRHVLPTLASTNPGDSQGIYWLGYKASVASPREFVELVACRELPAQENGLRAFMVASQPVTTKDAPTRRGYERGRYASWEYVCEKRDANDTSKTVIEWTCIQQSSAGGWVPGFLSDYVAANDFANDVVHFIDYIKNNA
ncbi:hypothetical protein BC940DRAFT_304230 [Gongronella butleri]|nr:hypothetical protein BC940DRAFT_304230 [Gongronella butleri]